MRLHRVRASWVFADLEIFLSWLVWHIRQETCPRAAIAVKGLFSEGRRLRDSRPGRRSNQASSNEIKFALICVGHIPPHSTRTCRAESRVHRYHLGLPVSTHIKRPTKSNAPRPSKCCPKENGQVLGGRCQVVVVWSALEVESEYTGAVGEIVGGLRPPEPYARNASFQCLHASPELYRIEQHVLPDNLKHRVF